MPLPRWIGKINKRVFNPREIRKNRYPVLSHVGRSSGRLYETPIDALETDTGFVCVVRYGTNSDWVQNTLANGDARIRVDGEEFALTSPRLLSEDEALTRFDPPEKFKTAEHFLFLDAVGNN